MTLEDRVAELERTVQGMTMVIVAATEWIAQATGTLRELAIEVDSPNIIIPGVNDNLN